MSTYKGRSIEPKHNAGCISFGKSKSAPIYHINKVDIGGHAWTDKESDLVLWVTDERGRETYLNLKPEIAKAVVEVINEANHGALVEQAEKDLQQRINGGL